MVDTGADVTRLELAGRIARTYDIHTEKPA